MKKYNFDEIIERRGTGAYKYDFFKENNKPEDAVPLWVADMDFRVSDEILDALHKDVDFGVFGYNGPSKDYFPAVSRWFRERFNWEPKEEWLAITPGVVFAFSTAINALTEKGDAVLIQTPVYYPFINAINRNERRLIENPLVLRDGHYEIDFEDFEKKIIDENVKLFILCSPHNPVGRVWKEDELRRMAEICRQHNVLIVADEIHCDFTWPGHKHHMFLETCSDYSDIAISCTAPSKTFNLAGLSTSNIWIPGSDLRKAFRIQLDKQGVGGANNLGMVACKAAYTKGEEWFNQCLDYMKGNLDYVKSCIEKEIPRLKVVEPEGTYLLWIDFSDLGMNVEELNDFVTNKAKLWVDEGRIFGSGGEPFQRIILACPRSLLEKAMEQLKVAVATL